MAIAVKVRNPKSFIEVQQNIEDLANSAMNKKAISGLTGGITIVTETSTSASAGYVQAEAQAVIDKLNEAITKQTEEIKKLNDVISRLIKT